jgi:PAT family beta-lactamase induction signal transducer AmpG
MGTGVNIMGYRIAMLVSGALALILADIMPWGSVYALLACMFLLGVAGTVLIEEKEIHFRNEQEPFLDRIRTAVIGPFQDFFKRKGAFEILLFLTVYKLGDVVASAMTTPFFLQTGFTKTDVGAVYKVFGMIATVVGGLWGGALLARLGIRKSLFIFGILQAATNLMFAVLAQAGPRYELLVTTVMLENLAGGMGTAAYSAFMMTLCRAQFTASQYALLSSLMAVARVFIGAPTGFMAKNLGWSEYYLATVVFAIPGLLMLVRYPRWENR